MKLTRQIFCVLTAFMLLTGCGSGSGGRIKVKEESSLNIMQESKIKPIENVTLYYDIGNNMGTIAQQNSFKDIAMVVNSVSSEIAASYNSKADTDADKREDNGEGESKYIIKLCDKSGSHECEDADFISYISNDSDYSNEKSMVFDNNLAGINPNDLTVMITDLAAQIDSDYVSVGDSLVKNILKKNLAVAYICVYDYKENPNNKPYFVVAIGNNDVVSEFVTDFKNDRTIKDFSTHTESTFEENVTDTINYEIFANKCGINGINYKDIEFIEKGIVYNIKNTEPNTEYETVIDDAGSFTVVNENFNSDNYLEIVEGTVNFNPNISNTDNDSEMLVKYAFDSKSRGEDGEDRERASAEDMRYLAVEPLKSETDSDIAGKIKMEVPFSIIDGVKLSLLNCDVKTELYYVDVDSDNNGEFKKYEGKSSIVTSIAEGVANVQGKWRIDDANDSLTFNIAVPHIDKLFENIKADTPFIKLNILFDHYRTKDYLPQWVLDLSTSDANSGAKVNNLQKFFDYIYDYQSKEDKTENGITVYIKNPNVETRSSER